MQVQARLTPPPLRGPKVDLARDEGSHPGSKTEWWYFNGHLEDDRGREYGFIHALFDNPDAIAARYNVDLPGMPGATDLDTGLTRESEGQHSHSGRMHIYPWFWHHPGIKQGTLDESFQADNGTLHVSRRDPTTIHLEGPTGDGQLDVDLKQVKPALMMGGEGEIKMGPFGLSKYYTFPRLEASGTLTVDGEKRPVHGTAWMDHQWGDMQLYHGYQGWDWFGIQLDNQTEINAFRFRDEKGGNASATVGLMRPDGTQEVTENLKLTSGGATFKSPQTGAEYPLEWHLSLPDKHVELDFKPTLADQEMVGYPPYRYPELAVKPTYWEGSVKVSGTVDDRPVTGKAYMELVGYRGDHLLDDNRLTPETVQLAQKLADSIQKGTDSVPIVK